MPSTADPFAPDVLADPYPLHERLREAGPVVRLDRYGIWASARYEPVRAALIDHEAFCSSAGVGLADFRKEAPRRPRSLILEVDPPAHTRARHLFNAVLSPAAVRGLRAAWTAVADALVRGLVDRGRFDGVRELAEPFPLAVFGDALGLPGEGRREHLLPFSDLVFNAFGPANELVLRTAGSGPPLFAWVSRHCHPDSVSPEGMCAQLHRAAVREGYHPEDAGRLVRAFLAAGLDTTVCGLANALLCFARHPQQYQALRADHGRARAAFDEVLRYETPVQTFFRTTTRDTELAGVPIPAGEKVLLFLGGANRDPRHWDEPARFDIGRRASGHLGYGAGIHACVGRTVAHLEGEIVLDTLARHAATIELDGEPVRRLNNTLRGLTSLPLRVTPA